MKQLALDIASPPEPTLDNFVPGRNAELVVTLYAVANNASHERFIYVWGPGGSGRTHLLHAVARAAREHGRDALAFAAGIAMDDVAANALVTADDVHMLDAAAQVALFNLHNRLRAGTGVLIASGNAVPAQLAIRVDLATRLAAGLVYPIHELSDDEKGAALRRHAQARGFNLPDDVGRYLLRHAPRDMPSLLEMLEALDRYSLETRRAVTVPLLRDLLPIFASVRAGKRGAAGSRSE
jgi:DnaA-homolog protein